MTSEPTEFKVVEKVTLEKFDCSGEVRHLIETIKLVDGVIAERIIHEPLQPGIHEEE